LPKTRVFALAKELGLESKVLVSLLGELGMRDLTAASALEDPQVVAAREAVRQRAEAAARRAEQERAAAAQPRTAPGAVALAAAAIKAAVPVVAAPEDFLDDIAAAAPAAAVAQAPAPAAVAEPPAKPKREKREAPRKPAVAEPDVSAEQVPEERGGRARDVERERERETEIAEVEEEELRQLEKELARLEHEEQRRAGLIALEALTPEEREEERRRGRDELVKPIPERAKRPTGPRPPDAITVPPVVCVLGHVDHGKTTLLDALRNTNVTAGEHGGITQHIGASEVEVGGRKIVFLDTPGHAAFTAMRARGALTTDIAVLVVAADDGVMPQTIEAINHARSAGVPIIVAINKMDAPGANLDRAKQELAAQDLVSEDWGGHTVQVPVSALKGEGLTDLLEMVFLVAETELGDLWGDPTAPFAGVVIEAKLDPTRGPVATVLVRNGSLAVGNIVICGMAHGRVRQLSDWRGKSVKSVGPGTPLEIVGLSDVPESGEVVELASSPKAARVLAEERTLATREDRLAASSRTILSDLFRQFQEGAPKQLSIVLKADVWGSLQAMRQALYELNDELDEVEIEIIHGVVGEVNESDILLAMAAKAIVLGFHVGADANARTMAENEGVDLRLYNVIYEAIEDIRDAMYGMLEPVYEDVVIGRAEVLATFKISRIGVIAGSLVTEGRVERGADIRVLRGEEVIYEGRLDSLKHVNEEMSAIEVGTECGIASEGFRGWKVGDVIECHRQVEVPRKLRSATEAGASVGAAR